MAKKNSGVKRPKGNRKHSGENLADYIDRQINIGIRDGFTIGEDISITQTLDVVIITLHEAFGFGEIRNKRFKDEFERIWQEFKDLSKDDTPDKEYTKACLDERLRVCVPKDLFCPYSERYKYDLDPKTNYKK